MSEYTIEGAMEIFLSIVASRRGYVLPAEVEALRDYITKLVEQDRKDAERYRWLRDKNDAHNEPRLSEEDGTIWRLTFYTPARIEDPTDDDNFDNAVDAARSASVEGGEK